MPNTYTLIASNTLSTATASVTFSSIPATYTDLVLVASVRESGTNGTINLYFNADTTATNYYRMVLGGTGYSSYGYLINDMGAGGLAPVSTDTANTFSNNSYYIPNYISSTIKSYSTDTVMENNATTAYMALIAGRWSGTAAITSITTYPADASNWVQYSTFYLYGIKNS